MHAIPLHQLHARRIRVEIEINRQTRYFHGTGEYLFWPEAGWVLRITITDIPNFSFILRENEWRGDIESSHTPHSDYHICLSQHEPYANPTING